MNKNRFYKRSIYLIDYKFQLRVALFIASLVFMLSFVYPWTIYELIKHLAMISPDQSIAQMFHKQRLTLILVLLAYHMGFILFVFLVCIFQSHKIAGPMYKMRMYLNGISEGKPIERLTFRNGDHFQPVADALNNALEHIQNEYNKDFTYLSETASYIKNLSIVVPEDKKPIIDEISKQLNEIQNRFRQL